MGSGANFINIPHKAAFNQDSLSLFVSLFITFLHHSHLIN